MKIITTNHLLCYWRSNGPMSFFDSLCAFNMCVVFIFKVTFHYNFHKKFIWFQLFQTVYKMKGFFNLFFVVFLGTQQKIQTLSKLKSKIVGIYSICRNSNQQQTELNRAAGIYSKYMREMFRRSCHWNSFCRDKGWKPLSEFREFDVCFNSTKLLQITLDILLDAGISTTNSSVPTNNEDEIIFV